MPTIELSLNVFILGMIVVVAAFLGYSVRSRQLAKSRVRIADLEEEMLNNYAEILELQKDYLNMESKLRDFQIPVIPIKTVVKETQEESQKFPDISLRKKLLDKNSQIKQSVASK
jgi:ABC-type siderophore export system fused ATPase/permease subunit